MDSIPERIYEPNIIHNPKKWFGIWTPHGWRVHAKRFGQAQRLTIRLSGDGRTTFFPHALRDPETGKMGWRDDLHLQDDPFTDRAIYPADPRVEYPAGRPRWAVSHTLLCYPFADHNLYTHEYTWDMVHGHLQTHFRKHVQLEQARTDSNDGMTVAVKNRPISRCIEGNVQYPLPCSAVRGVWDNPGKQGENYYTRRVVQLMPMHNAVYGTPRHTPVVQCYGMWDVLPTDPLSECFDPDSGDLTDRQRVIEQMKIPLDEPKIGMVMPKFKKVPSKVYEQEVGMVAEPDVTVTEAHLNLLRERKGAEFEMGRVGYGRKGHWDGLRLDVPDYTCTFDLNDDGVIDEADEQRLAKHVGRTVRANLYLHAYFGGDWLTTSVCLEPEHRKGIPAVADYVYGGGYDSEAGVVRLVRTPGPDRPVWIEYHHDVPAEPGENNIVVHLYREM